MLLMLAEDFPAVAQVLALIHSQEFMQGHSLRLAMPPTESSQNGIRFGCPCVGTVPMPSRIELVSPLSLVLAAKNGRTKARIWV
jgi:hypothetical protein